MRFFKTAAARILFAALIGAAHDTSAQTATGTILGEVKDVSGAALPGATVSATNQANGAVRETVSDSLGNYRFTALTPGVYTVKVAMAGFRDGARENVRLPIASQVAVPFSLDIAGLAETVTVAASAPLVDTTEQVVKTLIDTKQIESLPLKTRALPI